MLSGVFGFLPSDKSVFLENVRCDRAVVPLAKINVESDIRSGPVKIAVWDKMPYQGVDLLLGNDFCGGKVFPSPHVTSKPVPEFPVSEMENAQSIYPACAVTRAQRKRESNNDNDQDEVHLAVTDLAIVNDLGEEASCSVDKLSPSELTQLQKADPELMS
ncbi:hypothetical protein Pcinc_000619 [Petrolisthes cinctipes]|uniref:Uncharacterized protein n=1 Tax=Petrolisthes cinctipes TaxID=88211 RepID=A0AAE1GPI2_PETCI|nr:hypothetical protein Pcinc_000619 [Petrolisthes cinctipes]